MLALLEEVGDVVPVLEKQRCRMARTCLLRARWISVRRLRLVLRLRITMEWEHLHFLVSARALWMTATILRLRRLELLASAV